MGSRGDPPQDEQQDRERDEQVDRNTRADRDRVERKRPERVEARRGHHPRDQGEHADRQELYDPRRESHHRVEEGVEKLGHDVAGLVGKRRDSRPEDDAEEDDRKHVGGCRRLDDVFGHDVEQQLDRRRGGRQLRELLLRRVRHVGADTRTDEVDHQKADHHSKQAGQQIVAECLAEEAAERSATADRRHARDDRGEHQRHDDHPQELHEEVADPTKQLGGRRPDDKASDRPHNHRHQYLPVEPTVPWKIRIMFHGDRPYAVRDREASYRERSAAVRFSVLKHFRANDHVPLHRVLPALQKATNRSAVRQQRVTLASTKMDRCNAWRHEEIEAGDASGRRSPRYRPQLRSLGLLLSSLLAPLVQRDSLRNGFGNALLDLFLTLLLDDRDLGDNQKLGFIVHLLLTIRERFPLREKLKVLEYVGHVKKVARRHLFGVFFVATFPIRVALDITASEVIEQLSDPTLSK